MGTRVRKKARDGKGRKGENELQCVVQEDARRRLRVLGPSHHVDGLLVLADVPQLFTRNQPSAPSTVQASKERNTHPITSDDQKVVIGPQSRLRRVRRPDDELLHGRISEGARYGEDPWKSQRVREGLREEEMGGKGETHR